MPSRFRSVQTGEYIESTGARMTFRPSRGLVPYQDQPLELVPAIMHQDITMTEPVVETIYIYRTKHGLIILAFFIGNLTMLLLLFTLAVLDAPH